MALHVHLARLESEGRQSLGEVRHVLPGAAADLESTKSAEAVLRPQPRFIHSLLGQLVGGKMQLWARSQPSLRTLAKSKEVAKKARKSAAYVSLWLFISLLFGAFISSFMATVGGRQRDL